MRTITFKVDEDEARMLRIAARRSKLTLSEYLRRQMRLRGDREVEPVELVRCRHTGAMIFAPSPQLPPLNTETVNAMLAEFPVKYLLDVNVLVAWGWKDHAEHERVSRWIGTARKKRGMILLTSAIPQLGFVRVSVQRTSGQVTPEAASRVLAGMLAALGARHRFVPDDQPASHWPAWCVVAARTTDAHLLALATANGAELATLDRGIPGAILVGEM